MEKLKLIPISVSDLFYLKIRDKIIDKINVESFGAIVNKIIDEIYSWNKISNPLISRHYKLLSQVHTKAELVKIVTETLKHYLKGYKIEKKSIALKGSQGWEELLIAAAVGAAFGFSVDRIWDYFDEETTFDVVVEEDGSTTIYELDEYGNIVSVRNVDDRGSN